MEILLLKMIILTLTTVTTVYGVKLTSFTLQNGKTAHDLRSDPLEVNDTRTIIIPKLYYDGKGPDAFFMVGYGEPPVERPSKAPGHKIPNEKGVCDILKGYNEETIVLKLPANFTTNSIDWLAMYCIAYKHTFGYVVFPRDSEAMKNLPEGKLENSPEACTGNQIKLPLILIVASNLLGRVANFFFS